VKALDLGRRSARKTASRVPPRRARLGGAVLAVGVLAALAPQSASARWARISQSPSSILPYYVCPPRPHGARCGAIEDPTRGGHRRGPIAAGGITAGPGREVSPAVFGTGVEGGYSPSDLRSAYALPPSPAGSGQTVAVVDAFHDPNAEADLGEYRKQYGLPPCTKNNGCFRQVDQTGGTSYPAPNREWAKEISTDLDMVSAICASCHILLVDASNAEDSSLAAAENEAVKLGATEISDSFAQPESSEQAPAYVHAGIPIAAAAGDHSSNAGVESPASYPSVIAVGGTSLRPGAGRRGWQETVWSPEILAEHVGTDSGCSKEPKPAWQTDGGCLFRTTNDVAAVADPNTPVSVYDSYETAGPWLLLGGTSVSAPIVAAAMALASPYTRLFEGAQALYLEAAGGAGFNDIVSGADGSCGNYLCQGAPGYDGPSGLGSLHGAPEVTPPTPLTAGASSITQTEANLGGTVNTHGSTVKGCRFEYGATGSYGSSVACSSLPGPAMSPIAVSASVAGLAAGAEYHFSLVISYRGGGSASGGDGAFTTRGRPPTVSTEAPSAVSQSSVSLNAQVNPNGAAVSACQFEYGATTSYGAFLPCAPAPGAGQSSVAVSAGLAGLSANGHLHFRVMAANQNGASYGGDRTVTLPPPPPSSVTGAPSAMTGGSATLTATIDPHGAPLTSCEFEFNSAETLIPCAAIPGPQEGPVTVSALVHGLRPGTTYRYRILAVNASGASYGAIREFSTLPSSALEAPPGGAELIRTTLRVGPRGDFKVSVRCAAGARRCIGTITLRTVIAVRSAGHPPTRRILTLAIGSFATTSGTVAGVRMRLTAKARGLLGRSRVLRARATVATTTAGAAQPWQALVTLRASAAGRPRTG
jgi:hypothetical protein